MTLRSESAHAAGAVGPLASARLVAFVPATDLARARAFFVDTLGLRLESEDGFGMMLEAAGTPVRVALVQDLSPAPFTILGWHVDDIEATLRALRERGVAPVRFGGGMPQDANAIWTAPGGARIAWFKDPDGNVLSITQIR